MYHRNNLDISELEGKVIKGVDESKDRITFYCTDGTSYQLFHSQDCCEHVYLEDVAGGELKDLVGEKIIRATEDTDIYERLGVVDNYFEDKPYFPESWTWTFYTIKTNKVTLVLRWLGESNGYYSETVDFCKV